MPQCLKMKEKIYGMRTVSNRWIRYGILTEFEFRKTLVLSHPGFEQGSLIGEIGRLTA